MADTAVTLSDDRISVLSNQEIAATGFNRKFKVLYTDVNAGTGSTDTVTVTLGTTPAKWLVDKAAVVVKTAFAGTTAFTAVVGTTTATNAFISSTSVMTATVISSAAALGPHTAASSTAQSALGLRAVFTNATGGSPSALTAGELDIYLNLKDLAQLP